ncbi:hypothetical protein SETIT_2G027600v2 [Setaria italica]|uniref:Uncharacterized protein n=1 Tax=Setaria italica TaxID=4555 RepID=A0A368PUG6_SETIT|nr:hypothetical protein SETIT_2G027600v2 [Setaria italica]
MVKEFVIFMEVGTFGWKELGLSTDDASWSKLHGGRNNGAGFGGTRKRVKGGLGSNGARFGGARKRVKGGLDMDREFAAMQAQFEANREAIKKIIRGEKINKRLIIGSGVAAVAFTWVIILQNQG